MVLKQYKLEYSTLSGVRRVSYFSWDIPAMIFSHAKNFQTFSLEPEASLRSLALCDNLGLDFENLQKLKSQFPKRINGIRYEDACLNPQLVTQDIYHFAGLDFDNETRHYVAEIANAPMSNETTLDPFSVEGRDSVRAMNQWRKSANFSMTQEIDKNCRDLYKVAGYKPMMTKRELQAEHYSLLASPHSRALCE